VAERAEIFLVATAAELVVLGGAVFLYVLVRELSGLPRPGRVRCATEKAKSACSVPQNDMNPELP